MIKKYSQRGFTLIELLVVIAIIGILSSVVLASLSTARNKGKVAAIKGEMNSLRTQIEVAADGGTYTASITTCITGIFNDPSLTTIKTGISDNGGTLSCSTDALGGKWSAMTTLPDATGHTFCVDSSGAALDKTSGGAQALGVCS